MLKKYLGRPTPHQTQSTWSPRRLPHTPPLRQGSSHPAAAAWDACESAKSALSSSSYVLTVRALYSFPVMVSWLTKSKVVSSLSFEESGLSLSSLISCRSSADPGNGPHFYSYPKPPGRTHSPALSQPPENRGSIESTL